MGATYVLTEGTPLLSGTKLKIIACCSMFCVNVVASGVWIQSASFLPMSWPHIAMVNWFCAGMRMGLSGFAFFILCYLIAEGAQTTQNAKKYLDYLAITAILSEMPFDLALQGSLYDTSYQNPLVTLTLGLMGILIIKEIEKREMDTVRLCLLSFCVIFAFAFIATRLNCDYGAGGVYSIIAIYSLRENKRLIQLSSAIIGFLIIERTAAIGAILALPLLMLYNGQRGACDTAWKKLLFYASYPTHLILLYIVSRGILPAISKIVLT